MDPRTPLRRQFLATIQMLENAIRACPDSLWGDRSRDPQFWGMVFHALFFLEYYHADSMENFDSEWGLTELDPTGVLPDRVFTKDEMLGYLDKNRARVRHLIETPDLEAPTKFGKFEGTMYEGLMHSLRHVQHHTAQLNFVLRQATGQEAPRWVGSVD